MQWWEVWCVQIHPAEVVSSQEFLHTPNSSWSFYLSQAIDFNSNCSPSAPPAWRFRDPHKPRTEVLPPAESDFSQKGLFRVGPSPVLWLILWPDDLNHLGHVSATSKTMRNLPMSSTDEGLCLIPMMSTGIMMNLKRSKKGPWDSDVNRLYLLKED